MELSNEVVLRPRFQRELTSDAQTVLDRFHEANSQQDQFVVNTVEHHVFIRYPKNNQTFWTPQLHLEIEDREDSDGSLLRGLFGPKPTVWTLFMFLHFVVVTLFLILGAWGYSLWTLEKSPVWAVVGMFTMVVLWFLLYFGGRLGKNSRTDEMLELHAFMESIIH
ncbi:GTP-binding protein [Sediminicola luteus]|uniref:GTP-binding protein n=1 Tax=Sediminicola luteus TaxID=319238 RepID=A0A2A4GCS1_9FLAO|nr:GTP-binding protein [Sediminicola luteus]PCE65766.1 hypothetical protein B7P33_00215 [Sediminicola luteus]